MTATEHGTHDGTATMVHRANQIAAFFSSYSHEEAVTGIANHLKQFWEPRMLAQLRTYLAGGSPGELSPLVAEAASRIE